MNNEQVEQTIRSYIPQIIHMSLATVKDNKPWVCEVHFAYDDELNIYFVSSTSTRHAQELNENPFVSANIVTQHHKNQKVRCVDLEGTAELLGDLNENHPGVQAYMQRFEKTGLVDDIKRDGKVGLFKVSVSDFYLFDSYGDQRAKHHLPWHDAVEKSST